MRSCGENRATKTANFFLQDSEIVVLSDGTKVAVCNQWAAKYPSDNFFKFAEKMNELGYGGDLQEI